MGESRGERSQSHGARSCPPAPDDAKWARWVPPAGVQELIPRWHPGLATAAISSQDQRASRPGGAQGTAQSIITIGWDTKVTRQGVEIIPTI